MFGSMVLEIAIGIVFVYLLLSLVISAACELISSIMQWRAEDLEEGIRRMLGDTQFPKMVPKNHESSLEDPAGTNLADDFYNHPLIKCLHQKNRRPSYIPAKTFVLVLLDIITPASGVGADVLQQVRDGIEKLPNSSLKQTLTVILNEANQDLEKFKTGIEEWFNNSMQRVSGWYKNRTQYVNFFLGVIAVIGFNADSILVIKSLSTNDVMRQAMVTQAEAYVKEAGARQPAPSATPATPTSPIPAASVGSPSPTPALTSNAASPSPAAPVSGPSPAPGLPASVASSTPAITSSSPSPSPAAPVSAPSAAPSLAANVASSSTALPASSPSPSSAAPASTPSAIDTTKAAASEFQKSVSEIQKQVETTGIPIGWIDSDKISPEEDFDKRRLPGSLLRGEDFKTWLNLWFSIIVYHFFGWLITIIAVTFGAPFWFDILGKIITVRSSGKRPANEKDEG